LPDPNGDVFAGGVFQAGNFIQIKVVQLVQNGFESAADFRVIDHPAQSGVAIAFNRQLDFEAMPVQAVALMRRRQVRQEVGGFKLKCFS